MQKFGLCISLTYNDLLEISAVSRTFYYLCRQNMRFAENLSHSRALFSGVNIFYQYKNRWFLFAEQLFYLLNDYFEEHVLFTLKNLLRLNLFSKFFLFVFSNHLFCCSRSYYCSYQFFPSSIREGIVLMYKVFFVHSYSAFAKEKIYSDHCNNFGVLYYNA